MMLTNMSHVHKAILNLGEALGYSDLRSTGGLCAGISWLWLSSYFIQNEEEFNLRILKISDELLSVIIDEISQVKEKVKIHEHLTEKDLAWLEILAFYDHITLYHFPTRWQPVLGTFYPFAQTALVTQRIASNKMELLGGLNLIYSDSDLYSTRTEIATYVSKVTELITSIDFKPNASIGVMLTNYGANGAHEISLAYDVNQKIWHLMDIEQWPTKTFNVSEVTYKIIEAFAEYPLPLVLSSEIVSTVQSTRAEKEKFDRLAYGLKSFNKHYQNFQKSLQYGFNTLLVAAVHVGNLGLVKILLSYPIDVNAQRLNGATAAFMAAQEGYAHIVKELALHNADLDLPHSSGTTPAYIAAQNGHLDVIRELGLQGADLNKSHNSGATPLWIATYFGHLELIKELGKYPIDVDQHPKGDASPLELARERGYKEIEMYLLKLISDRRLSYGISDVLSRNGIFKTFLQTSNKHIHVQCTRAVLGQVFQ